MKRNLFIIIFGLFTSLNVYAFKFSPMSTSIGVKSDKSSTLFFLENDSDQPIAVTASVMKREMNIDGVETNQKVGDEITVYPSQLIIPPNEKRSVKVTWIGKSVPTAELNYRLVAEQLPIDLDKNKKQKASIKVLLRYVAALYVLPEDFSSDIMLKKIDIDEKNISFLISNLGKKHQVLSDLSLKVTGKKTIDFIAEELKGMSGENVLGQSERIFRFPRNGKFKEIQPTDKVKVNFEKD
ncbi:MAG: fimbria/pilus periplasmic chaperone [Bdellovibrionales bacterium]|nr:fimbria/pilus periplasmic chaperone [Bdellovibrionales bacterium]